MRLAFFFVFDLRMFGLRGDWNFRGDNAAKENIHESYESGFFLMHAESRGIICNYCLMMCDGIVIITYTELIV